MSGYKHDDCAICGAEIGYSEIAEKLPSGLLRCSGCSSEAARIDSLANRNDRAAIDGFLSRVRERAISKGQQQADLPPIVILQATIDEVYAEMFPGDQESD